MTAKLEDLILWLSKGGDPYYGLTVDLIEELQAQNTRLGEALRVVFKAKVGPCGDCGTTYCSGCDVCRARVVLREFDKKVTRALEAKP